MLATTYRPDIDGMRAVAVLAVVSYHAFPDRLPGGFVGVDVFFVISGFLISSIIIQNARRGTFTFREFYARRIARIFPALVLTLTASICFGWCVLLRDEFVQLGKHVAGGVAFIPNLVLWTEAGYFDRSAELKPLLHLWSLGVEEQFYLVWPVVVLVAFAARRQVVGVIVVLMVASFVLNVATVFKQEASAFFNPLSRAWQLLSGGVLSALLLTPEPEGRDDAVVRGWTMRAARFARALPATRLAAPASLVGLAMIVFACVTLDNNCRFPGFWAVLPTLGTVLVIAAGANAWPNKSLLGIKPMVAVGLISYPLYLWHWPLLSFANIIEEGSPAVSIRLTLVATAFALATLTYLLVEKPIRSGRLPKRPVMAALVAPTAALGLFGVLIWRGEIATRIKNPVLDAYIAASEDWDFPPRSGRTWAFNGFTVHTVDAIGDGEVLFVGDSNMRQFFPRIEDTINAKPEASYSATILASGGCRPLFDVMKRNERHCLKLMPTMVDYVQTHDVRRVVLAGRWHQGLYGEPLVLVVDDKVVSLAEEHAREIVKNRLVSELKKLTAKGIEVFLIQNIPSGPEIAPPHLGRQRLALDAAKIRVTLVEKVRRAAAVDEAGRAFLADAARQAGATIVDPITTFCDATTCPLVDKKGIPAFMDSAHLTATYVRETAVFLDPLIARPRTAAKGEMR